jgi:hypothetical protein
MIDERDAVDGNAVQAAGDAIEDARREADEHDPVGAIIRAIETIEREERSDGQLLPMGSPFWIRLRVASERGKVRNMNPSGREMAQAQAAFWERLVNTGATSASGLLDMSEETAQTVFGICPGKARDLVSTLRMDGPLASCVR